MNSIRRIAHLDMDAFFASVELLSFPELRGKAVVVGGRSVHQPVALPDGTRRFALLRDYVGRGVITTSTYEARALGVFSGMGLMKSAKMRRRRFFSLLISMPTGISRASSRRPWRALHRSSKIAELMKSISI